MKKLALLLLITTLTSTGIGQVPWEKGKLGVSQNGRYLQHDNGEPFFWLGDTAWLLFQRLDRDQIVQYFENRKEKGFNVVQCIFHQNHTHTNAYGDPAYLNSDFTQSAQTPGNDPQDAEQYDYWDHVDYAVDVAAQNGIYVALVTSWRDLIKREQNLTAEKIESFTTHLVPFPLNKFNFFSYVIPDLIRNPGSKTRIPAFAGMTKCETNFLETALANHFKDKPNIIWINGGSARGQRNTEIWETIGATLKKTDPHHLITFHPFGRMQTSTWFQNASWLDLNMFSSGHRNYEQDNTTKKYGEDNWRYVLEDLAKTPLKPTIDGEPSYENLPEGIHDHTLPYWQASDVRRYAYWSVFAGACGHVYGENSVRQVHIQGVNKAESGAKLDFFEALDALGAFQMQNVKKLILSRPYFERVNDQSAVAGDEGERYDRILVTRGRDYLMAYNYTGRTFTLQMGKISGEKVTAWWHDTRTGEAYNIGTFANKGSQNFDPPGVKHNGNDWVLVLDNAAKKFGKPGKERASNDV